MTKRRKTHSAAIKAAASEFATLMAEADAADGGRRHSHWSEEAGRFMEHAHLHSGPHDHDVMDRGDGTPVLVVVRGPGNYSPRGLPEGRDVAQDREGQEV